MSDPATAVCWDGQSAPWGGACPQSGHCHTPFSGPNTTPQVGQVVSIRLT